MEICLMFVCVFMCVYVRRRGDISDTFCKKEGLTYGKGGEAVSLFQKRDSMFQFLYLARFKA